MKRMLTLFALLLALAVPTVQAVDIPDCDNHCMMFHCPGYGDYAACVQHCKDVLCCADGESYC